MASVSVHHQAKACLPCPEVKVPKVPVPRVPRVPAVKAKARVARARVRVKVKAAVALLRLSPAASEARDPRVAVEASLALKSMITVSHGFHPYPVNLHPAQRAAKAAKAAKVKARAKAATVRAKAATARAKAATVRAKEVMAKEKARARAIADLFPETPFPVIQHQPTHPFQARPKLKRTTKKQLSLSTKKQPRLSTSTATAVSTRKRDSHLPCAAGSSAWAEWAKARVREEADPLHRWNLFASFVDVKNLLRCHPYRHLQRPKCADVPLHPLRHRSRKQVLLVPHQQPIPSPPPNQRRSQRLSNPLRNLHHSPRLSLHPNLRTSPRRILLLNLRTSPRRILRLFQRQILHLFPHRGQLRSH